jgi:hypothetical protein
MSQGTLRPTGQASTPKTSYGLIAVNLNKLIAQGGTYIIVRK